MTQICHVRQTLHLTAVRFHRSMHAHPGIFQKLGMAFPCAQQICRLLMMRSIAAYRPRLQRLASAVVKLFRGVQYEQTFPIRSPELD